MSPIIDEGGEYQSRVPVLKCGNCVKNRCKHVDKYKHSLQNSQLQEQTTHKCKLQKCWIHDT